MTDKRIPIDYLNLEDKVVVSTATTSESTSLSAMQRLCPTFFRTPHGKRESFVIHRGQLIVRNTVQFTGSESERKTTVYLFIHRPDSDSFDFACASAGAKVHSIAQGKKLIDAILARGSYYYGFSIS